MASLLSVLLGEAPLVGFGDETRPADVTASAQHVSKEPVQIVIQADKPGIPISPLLYGTFFEEVSRAGDGGLYAELIRNGNFRAGLLPEGFRLEGKELITPAGLRHPAREVGDPLDGWFACRQAQVSVVPALDECNEEGFAGRIVITNAGDGLSNSGYYGIPVEQGKRYRLLIISRIDKGAPKTMRVELVDRGNNSIGEACLAMKGDGWVRQETTLTAAAGEPSATLRFTFAAPATVLLRYVSLLPAEQWHCLPLRVDLAEKLKALKPAFMRFPGGGFVHNLSLNTGWNWKETIGPVERRPGRIGMWGYRSTDGLGYYEYLLLCEKLKMEPVPVVNVGISCMAFKYEVEPMEKMGRWVQDALDAIEYANGPVDSTWGKVRAANGHPAPFAIKYMAIGNECGGEAYAQRYPLFYQAIKKRYPELTLIACENIQNAHVAVDLFDQHPNCMQPEWYIRNAGYYDRMPRTSKIFVSEFSAYDGSQGNLIGALGEAVFMLGMERNSDLVPLSAYAPLFINVKHRNWPVSMFVFDNTRSYGTPSYHAVKMFNESRGDHCLPCTVSAPKARRRIAPVGGVGIGTWLTQLEAKDVRVSCGEQPLAVVAAGADWTPWKKPVGQWQVKPDGVLYQGGEQPMTCAHIGDKDWNNYSYTLNIRKTGGNEGAVIYFAYQDAANTLFLNLGGFGNRAALIEQRINGERKEVTPRVPFTMEPMRWYEVTIDYGRDRLRCLVDGTVLFDLPMDAVTREEEHDQVFASASRTADGRIYARAVNVSAQPFQAVFRFEGLGHSAGAVKAICMSCNDPRAENSFEAQERISPRPHQISIDGPLVRCCLPPYSLCTFSLREPDRHL